jgi:hypothetical protein
MHAQRRVAGAHRVILVGERRAEQRHDAIAHHKIDGALIVMHCFHHAVEHRLEDRARLLGIALGDQLHGAFQVCEQHRYLLALAFERGARGENFFGEMFRGVIAGGGKARLRWDRGLRSELDAAFGAEFCRSGIDVAARGAGARQRRAAFRAELRRIGDARVAARAVHRGIQGRPFRRRQAGGARAWPMIAPRSGCCDVPGTLATAKTGSPSDPW